RRVDPCRDGEVLEESRDGMQDYAEQQCIRAHGIEGVESIGWLHVLVLATSRGNSTPPGCRSGAAGGIPTKSEPFPDDSWRPELYRAAHGTPTPFPDGHSAYRLWERNVSVIGRSAEASFRVQPADTAQALAISPEDAYRRR